MAKQMRQTRLNNQTNEAASPPAVARDDRGEVQEAARLREPRLKILADKKDWFGAQDFFQTLPWSFGL
jgi:hypothetical protein